MNVEFDVITCNSLSITSVNDKLGVHVPQATKQKIMNGELVELHCLLNRYTDNEYQNENKSTFTNGQFTVKSLGHSKINDIQTWLDAFFIFSSVYLCAHSDQAQQLLKYMSIIKTAASRCYGFGWREYDRQFRMKKAKYTTITWNHIDQELWLLFVNGNHKQTWSNQNQNTFSKSQKMCFDFNNTGYCGRQHCQYSHSCLKCAGRHPASKCSEKQDTVCKPIRSAQDVSNFFRRSGHKQTNNANKNRIHSY